MAKSMRCEAEQKSYYTLGKQPYAEGNVATKSVRRQALPCRTEFGSTRLETDPAGQHQQVRKH